MDTTDHRKTEPKIVKNNYLPPAVNWHFWPWCNYGCKFCFAQFEDIPRADRLERHIALSVPEMLAEAGAKKITFVGGEPTLCPYLGDLLTVSKELGLTTCIVSNATGLTEKFLDEWGHVIDWIGLSIDASNDLIHAQIGRGMRSDLSRGKSNHLSLAKETWKRCQARGIRMKLNTVVCSHNLDDDMTDLVLELMPERWKIFQVLEVEGQNDRDIDDLLVTQEAFESWVSRHRSVSNKGIQFVPESNDLMRGSYAMIDALGRFYTNVDGGHRYGPPIVSVGVKAAWEQNVFLEERFNQRGGVYDWAEDSNPNDSVKEGGF